ncbi:hypothetical protein MIR68_009041 [Amoeboaphelidium protococcarum]|nr:hypothetical protein MIR68_009041 [Amoeboaphelidium protococcarum]
MRRSSSMWMFDHKSDILNESWLRLAGSTYRVCACKCAPMLITVLQSALDRCAQWRNQLSIPENLLVKVSNLKILGTLRVPLRSARYATGCARETSHLWMLLLVQRIQVLDCSCLIVCKQCIAQYQMLIM